MKINNIKNTVRAVIFLSLFALIFIMLSNVFIPQRNNNEDGMESRISKAYRGEPINSIDTVFIGNSDMYRGVSPVDLYHTTGITSIIAGKPNKNFSDIPADVKDILKYQNPKVLVVDTDCMFTGINSQFKKKSVSKPPQADAPFPVTAYDKAVSFFHKIKNKVKNGDSSILAAINYKFPLIKYHDNWTKIRLSALLDPNMKYKFSNKGMAYSNAIKPYTEGNSYMKDTTGKAAVLSDEKRSALNHLSRICKKNDIALVFITIPSANSWNSSKSLAVKEIAEEYDIPYYDYNTVYPKGFDWNTCTTDAGNHLNYRGAMTVTWDIGEKLKGDFSMERTKLSKHEENQWEMDYEHFHENIVGDKKGE